LVTKRDITMGKLAVKNGFMTPQQMKDVLDLLESSDGASGFVAAAVEQGLLEKRQGAAITLACDRMERDSEKQSMSVAGYEIISKIGEGGLGVVYKALQKSMNRVVALKILHRKWLDDEEFRKRFLLEARLMGKLSHPNLINVYDVGKEDWKYYFSMEFIEGVSVEELLDRFGAMDVTRSIDIVTQVAKAINYLQEQGIVHCDIKPGNVLLTKDDIAKLGDFGFVRIGRELDRQIEGDDSVLGTPEYISPEQALGEKAIDWRSDIYSLGVTLFHMVTGRPPYEGPSGAIMQKHVKGELPDPRTYNRDLSRELCNVIRRMMARQPSDRYESVERLIEDLAVARMAEDPRGSDAHVGKTTILSALKREKMLAERYSMQASELKESVANYKLYFFLALGVLILSLVLNLYLFIKLLAD
jgi:serine/threonine protein kinase